MRRRYSAHALLTLAAIAGSLVWSLVLALPHLAGEASFLDRIEAPLADLRFLIAGPRPAPEHVVIVAIDDDTIRAAGAYPLPRSYTTRLLRALASSAPKAVGVDILFLDPGAQASDAELADALRAAPTVIASAARFARIGGEARASSGPFENVPVAERLERPAQRFRDAARSGLVNIATDHGGTPRHVPLLVAGEGGLHAALALRVAALASNREPDLSRDAVALGPVAAPLDLGASLALRFYGPQGSIRTLSARALVDGEVPREALANRVVLVGATALGVGDTLSTPFDPVLPGVEIQASATAHLLHGDALMRTTAIRRIDAAAAVLLPILVLLTLSIRRVGIGLALGAGVLAAFAGLAVVSFANGIWLSLSLPLAAMLVPVAPTLGLRLWLDRRAERRLSASRDALLRFHPPLVAARLESRPDFLDAPVEQHAAVLFLDLSGFTGLSERLGPARTRDLLKEMHERVESEASARDGSVTSFMGDGAMLLFGLPEPRADDADRAVATAFALSHVLRDWLAASLGGGGVRIGVHAGPVVVSRLGGARNQHITATGDTVNVASRLMEVAKAETATIVLSAALVATMRDPVAYGAPMRVSLRGRAEPLDVIPIRDLSRVS